MDETKLVEYGGIRAKIKELEAQKDLLGAEILADMKAEGQLSVKEEFGTFSIKPTTTWKYSNAVKVKKNEMDDLKKVEEENGIATKTVTESLVYTSKKAIENAPE